MSRTISADELKRILEQHKLWRETNGSQGAGADLAGADFTLVGLTHEDQIGFCSEAAAAEWVSSINRKNAAGTVDYKIVKWSTR